jgi:hypothetical protein
MDADDECPVKLAAGVERRAESHAKEHRIGVVIANREYEAWFLAGAASLAGKRRFTANLKHPSSPDAIRDAKGWLSQHMTEGRYHEVLDQPALSAVFDIAAATQGSRSLRKLVETVDRLLDGHSARPL